MSAFGQEDGKSETIIYSIIRSNKIVDQNTTLRPKKGQIKASIVHRFGPVGNGASDLFGIYGPFNMLMGVEYAPIRNVAIGFSTEKTNKTQEFSLRWLLMNQNTSGSKPFSLAFYSNASIDARSKEVFGDDYKDVDRLFYTNELIFSKQIKYKLYLLTNLSYVHFNKVPRTNQLDKAAFSLGFGYKIGKQMTLLGNYQHPLDVTILEDNAQATINPIPNYSLGCELNTTSHSFQVYLASASNLSNAKDYLINTENFTIENLRIGFNISMSLNKHK